MEKMGWKEIGSSRISDHVKTRNLHTNSSTDPFSMKVILNHGETENTEISFSDTAPLFRNGKGAGGEGLKWLVFIVVHHET
jgi:hypothetical protein